MFVHLVSNCAKVTKVTTSMEILVWKMGIYTAMLAPLKNGYDEF